MRIEVQLRPTVLPRIMDRLGWGLGDRFWPSAEVFWETEFTSASACEAACR
jgi:hypothetical protein